MNLENLIKKIIASDILYARFLNTLSLMEYIGARKIVKSQQQQHLNKKLLDHMAEEMRHAQLLKRAAIKLAPLLCDSYAPEALLCGAEAYHYFQTIDHAAERELNVNDPWYCYLYTTFLIETRVLLFYGTFERILKENEKPNVFKGILAEEKKHLAEILYFLNKVPDYEKNIVLLKTIEEEAFCKFLTAAEKEISACC